MSGRKLILVRHSLPELTAEVPSAGWRLSEEGHLRCRSLAERLAVYRPRLIASSPEVKAVQTAENVAKPLGRPIEVVTGLREHDRSEQNWLSSRVAFQDALSELFARPDDLVFGRETAAQARERFAGAVEGVLGRSTQGDIVIVAHGTVISLFVARSADVEPFTFWRRLGLPSFAVLSVPGLALLSVVEKIE